MWHVLTGEGELVTASTSVIKKFCHLDSSAETEKNSCCQAQEALLRTQLREQEEKRSGKLPVHLSSSNLLIFL
jgi:hypothetical protein